MKRTIFAAMFAVLLQLVTGDAVAFEHLCFYGPAPLPGLPLSPTLWQEMSASTSESTFYQIMEQSNRETTVPYNGIVGGGEVFRHGIQPGDTSTYEVVLVFVPIQAAWYLSGYGHLEGQIRIGDIGLGTMYVPVITSDTCYSQGLVTPR